MLLLYNHLSGKGIIKTKLAEMIDRFVKMGFEVVVHPTQKAGDACDQVILHADEVDVITCCGGDGTLDEVASGMLQSACSAPLCYIPTGSTNDFASSLSIPKKPLKAANLVRKGRIYHCDLGRFNERNFVYIAAFGLFTDVSYETNQEAKKLLGHTAYLLEAMKKVFDVKSYPMHVEFNDQVLEDEFIYGMITNSRRVGGIQNLPGRTVDMNDGLYEVSLVKRPKNPFQLEEILAAMMTEDATSDLLYTGKTNKITISSPIDITWTLDGEFGGQYQEVEIETLQKALPIFLKKHS